jgi:hypothetical protein
MRASELQDMIIVCLIRLSVGRHTRRRLRLRRILTSLGIVIVNKYKKKASKMKSCVFTESSQWHGFAARAPATSRILPV